MTSGNSPKEQLADGNDSLAVMSPMAATTALSSNMGASSMSTKSGPLPKAAKSERKGGENDVSRRDPVERIGPTTREPVRV